MELTKKPNSIYAVSLVFVIVIFGGVSAATMILFCISLTENPTGQVLAGATGLGMVVAQYAFVYRINEGQKFNGIGWLIVLCLFVASVTGTYSWIESEFKTGTAINTQQSDSYQDYSELIAMKKATIKENLEQAKADRTNQEGNYNGRAISTTSDAEKGQQELKKLIDERDQLPSSGPVKSSQALAADLGSYRFIAWLFWALVVDICPLYAIHRLSKPDSDTCSDTEKNSATASATLAVSATTEKSKQSKNNSATSAAENGTDYLGPYKRVRLALLSNEVKPGKNAVRVKFNLGTATVDKVFDQLLQNNVIRRSQNNRTYELVKSELVEK